MLWLARPPLLRWLAAAVLVLIAAWTELAPPPASEQFFLTEDVPAGTPLEPHHVERRTVANGVIDTVEPSGVAATDLRAGDPLLASMSTDTIVPEGWVIIEAAVPAHASPGAGATAIILGRESAPVQFPAVVVRQGGSDPFEGGQGVIAVPPDWTGPAAGASAEGRLVIGVQTSGR